MQRKRRILNDLLPQSHAVQAIVSSGLSDARELVYKIWNPFENDEAKPIKNDLLIASDHFPITLDLDISLIKQLRTPL